MLTPDQVAAIEARGREQALGNAEAQLVQARLNLKLAEHNVRQAEAELAALTALFGEPE